MKISEILQKEDQQRLGLLVKDLLRLGNYSNWGNPTGSDNINWFNNNRGNLSLEEAFHDDELLAQRIEILALKGADLTDKAYLVSNVNRPKALAMAFKYGANPNTPGKSGMTLVDRAITRKRTKILEILVECDSFDWNVGRNLLFVAIENNKFKLATTIAEKKPEYILSKEYDGNILNALAVALKKKEPNSKAITFINLCLEHADNHDFMFSINDSNQFGIATSVNPFIAEIIAKHNAENLQVKLSSTNENKTVKLKI